ncbi:caspase 10 L homeolog isoform X1 [Xenopus laevis]|uniref:Caspase-8 n=2 Tax=Xenopus laevis TaxID=8355 RepID=Q6PAD9_XENLA|nr:caspase 10 L homeolog [Xenopus laevis]XP_018089665.1 caspase 10 L homeolog isoform X1 [Xenopus laevis]XP_018089666.1 caspase 10 L homeolog isoform X1 [Xenopus laevis]XP_018089667.1 caspase 10 L homeolog isoform X1 [Xenopus laevis]XP_018089668.1 caspase 10 L homeolog isoform X1 [Xenopus laevis]XP_041431479.1 caspase 10 L homeolog isoform X1 [Xenopus laevis]AAH60356.1 MGC68465 protein [Xenopus laevis]OCT63812.1 hypothetical protein XELAEV_18044909mg [Xenopus laevis]
MDFNSMLLSIDDGLGREDIEALKFLCRDVLRKNKLLSVRSGQELFQQLKTEDLISEDDFFLLAELLYIINHHSLLRDLGTNKENVQKDLPHQGKISSYRRMLYELSENVTGDDEKRILFLLPFQKKHKENKTFLDVLCQLEKENSITEDNVGLLEDIFKKVSPDLLKIIEKYKERENNLQPSAPPEYEHELINPPLSIQVSSKNNESWNEETEDLIEHIGTIHEEAEKEDDKSGNIDNQLSDLRLNPEITPQASLKMELYDMNRKHRGYCLIIDNSIFAKGKRREGSDKDAGALRDVFKWLGLDVEIVENLGSEEIRDRIKKFKSKDHSERDCFVCCILTHGESGTVLGSDDEEVSIREIMSYFTPTSCLSLALKPKLFFIQACQGRYTHPSSKVEADATVPVEHKKYIVNVPKEADFLLGMSTVDGYFAFRHRTEGSWYIQALCKNLVEMVPRGEDILSILTKVNKDVSLKEDSEGILKQMPQPSYTLLKKLIFPVPNVPFKPNICQENSP